MYQELGYDLVDLLKLNSGYKNTCATRMSVALLKAGVSIAGRLKIKSGKSVEPGAKLLADLAFALSHLLPHAISHC